MIACTELDPIQQYQFHMYDKTDKNGTIYSLTIIITKISLKVRFPCSICCSIKLDGQQRQILGEGELRNGEATLKLTFTTQLFIPFRKDINGLSEKKCSLLIYLKSSSGRIPAGSVSVLLQRAETRPNREISRIQKCPDKNALIQFQVKLDKLEEKRDGYNYSSYKQLSFRQEASKITLKNNKSLEKSIDEKNTSIGYMMNSQIQKNKGKETISILRRAASKREGQVRSSIFQSYYSGQIKAKDSQKIFALEREIDNYKSKLMILESQLTNKTNRFNQLQKEQKNSIKKNEQIQLQFKAAVSKLDYAQKSNRDLNNAIKQLKQKLQEDKLAFQNSIKRWQIRQNSFKEQIKGITQKLYNSQNQKQRMVFQKNISSNQFQGRQKKIRQGFKQKQKKMLQQRTSLLKQIDSLQKDIFKQKQQISDTKTKNIDNTQHVHQLKLLLETCDAQKQKFRSECSDLRFEMTKLRNEKKILQENMDSMGKFNQQRRNFRKQISEKDLQVTQIRDKYNSLQAQLSRAKSQNQQLQKQLRQKTNEIKIIDRDLNLISKQNKILVSQITDKQSKISSLIQQLQLQMKKTKFYQGSLQQMQQQFQIKQDSLQMEIRQHRNMKKMLQEEIQKLNQQSQMTNEQLASHVKDIQQLEQILEEKNQEISKMQSQLIQINNLNQQLQMEKLELGEDRKQLQDNYQNRMEESQEQIKILNMKIQALSQTYEKTISEARDDIKAHYQKVMSLQKQLRYKQDNISKLEQKIVQLTREIKVSKQQKESCINIGQQMKKEVSNLLENIEKHKKQISDKQLVIQSLRNHIQTLEQQSSEITNNKQIIKSDYSQLQNSYQKLQRETYEYQQMIDMLLQNIYDIASKKNPKQLKQIVGIKESLDRKSKQIIKKITTNYKQTQARLQQRQKKIAQLITENKLLHEQKQKKQTDLLHADHHLTLLRKNTNDYGQEITSKNNQIKRLNEELSAKQEQILGITQSNNKKFISLSSHLSQKNHQIAELNQKVEQFQNQIGQLGAQIQQLNEYIKKTEKDFKNMDSQQKSKLGYIDINLRNQMERANNLQSEKSSLEKQLRQQKQSLRKVMRQLQSKCYEAQDLQIRLQENQSIVKMRQVQSKKLKEANTQYKRLFDAFFTIDLQFSSQGTPINLKIDKYFSQPVNKQLQLLKQRVKNFYEIFVDISVSNFQLGKNNSQNQRVIQQQSQMIDQLKQKYYMQSQQSSKQLFQLKSILQGKNKQTQKQIDSKQQLIKTIDEIKAPIDFLKRFTEQLNKILSSLQKQKKASIFVLSPLKQLQKKIDEQVTQIIKLLSAQVLKNKREIDLSKLRMKKSISKKQDFSTSFRPI